jgi:cbb3-type cytochrome oxidase cytochrome c subunit
MLLLSQERIEGRYIHTFHNGQVSQPSAYIYESIHPPKVVLFQHETKFNA